MSKVTVTIPLADYEELLKDQFFLQCLSNAGVDNWEGYEYAIEEFQKEQE